MLLGAFPRQQQHTAEWDELRTRPVHVPPDRATMPQHLTLELVRACSKLLELLLQLDDLLHARDIHAFLRQFLDLSQPLEVPCGVSPRVAHRAFGLEQTPAFVDTE